MNKAEYIDWLQHSHADFRATLDQVPADRWEEAGVAGSWSMKDVLAHLTGWNRKLVAELDAEQRGAPAPAMPWSAELESDDEINAWFYEHNHSRQLNELLEEEQQVFDELVAIIGRFPDDILIETVVHEGRDFHLLHWNGKRLHAGELFDHYRDDHEAEVRAFFGFDD